MRISDWSSDVCSSDLPAAYRRRCGHSIDEHMNREKPKTFHVKSFGCQMNVYDGERMAEMLSAEGMMADEESMDADIVVLNTCHMREKAAEKVYSDIGRLKRRDGQSPITEVRKTRVEG